jgi:hypothetical protein
VSDNTKPAPGKAVTFLGASESEYANTASAPRQARYGIPYQRGIGKRQGFTRNIALFFLLTHF